MGVFQEGFVRSHVVLEEYPICVETGTNLGYSTGMIAELVPRVYTIEIKEELYERARQSLDVTCILGDSITELPRLIPELNEPTVFFLDAHFSGDHTTDWATSHFSGYGVDTGCGETGQVPLIEEITAIVDLFPHRCVVYIDDMDKFDETGQGLKDKGFKGEDWSKLHLDDIMGKLKPRLERVETEEHQMIAILRAR